MRANMPSLVEQFKGRNHSPLVQFVKYGIGGVAATVVHISIFTACALWLFPALTQEDRIVGLLHLQTPEITTAIRARNSIIDTTIAFFFSNLTAYLINVAWVFEAGRHNRWVEIGYFYLVSGIAMVIGTAMQGYLILHFHYTTTLAFGANIIASIMLNFVLRKFLIFKK